MRGCVDVAWLKREEGKGGEIDLRYTVGRYPLLVKFSSIFPCFFPDFFPYPAETSCGARRRNSGQMDDSLAWLYLLKLG